MGVYVVILYLMAKQKSYKGREILKIFFLAGLNLYTYFTFSWVIASLELLGVCGNKISIESCYLYHLFYPAVILAWVGSILYMIISLNRLGVPRVPVIIGLGTLTFLCIGWIFVTNPVFSSWTYYQIFLFIFIIYPLIYGGFYWLFNQFLPTLEKK